MKITNHNKSKDIVRFNVSGVDGKVVNALRRIIISGVPSMAIEKVIFYSNSSILNDEIIAHRMGMVPIKTDLKTYTLPSECTCKGKGCAKCTVKFTAEVDGPKIFYSGDLKSTDPEVNPVHDKIPIINLADKQKIKVEATAQLGFGREHIKWQAGIASYEHKDNDSYDFMVESFGQYTAEGLLTNAFNIFEGRLKELKSKVG